MEVLVLPLECQKWFLVHDKVLAKTEKAFNVWLEDMSQEHIPADGKIMHEKAL